MIDRLIYFSVKNKLFVGILVLALIAWGSYSLLQLPVDAVPDVTSNQVDVITNSPSLAALEIERFITSPLEMAMSNIPGLVEVRSVSKFGLSVVKLVFDDDTDVYWARQQVFERLEMVKAEIPSELGAPYMGPVSTGLGEVFQYVIRPKDPNDKSFSLMEIRTLQDWVIRRQLLGIPGIAEVSGFGGYKKEYQAMIKPDRMRALGISLDELFLALSSGNSNTGGAYIEKENKAFTIRGIGLANSLEEIGNTVVKVNNRVPVLVKDVADVVFGNSIRYGAITVDGQNEAVGGIIMMVKGENGSRVIQRIKERMKLIQAKLPEGLVIEPFIDREKIVSKAIKTVTTNLIEGALIVILVILLFLGDWRASLLAASVIPLSMLFAFGLMIQFDVVGNLMSLGAIDFGLLVDPAIIIVESVVFYLALEISKNPGEMDQLQKERVVIQASQAAKKSVVFGGLIILIVYFPILTLSGIEGKMFGPMAKTVSFAILGALLLAITYVPMVSSLILQPPKSPDHHGFSEKIVQWLFRFYEPLIRFGLEKRSAIILTAVGILIAGVVAFKNIGGEFIPKLAEGDLVIETNLPVGTSMTETIKLSKKIQTLLLKNYPDEIERVVSKIGTSEVPVDPMPMEAQEIVVVLTDKSTWTKAEDQEGLVELIAEDLKIYPGIVNSIQQPIENRVNELMSGARTDVVIKLFGNNLDTMVVKGNQIIKIIKGVQGAADVQENKIFGLPQINIKYNRDAMAFYGVTVTQINRAIQTAFAGSVAGIVYENDKRFDLTLRLGGDDRTKAENIRNLIINDKDNNPIPLQQLATITEEIGPSEIGHENLQRRMNIGFNVRGRDLESVVNDAMVDINQKIILPAGYSVEFGGEFENFRRAKERLAIVVPISLIIIFGLLFATFGNTRDSLLIYTVVPLSAVGGVFSLLIRGMNFSISAGVGFIALFGIAVLNGILIISHFNTLENAGMTDIRERVVKGLRERFRPVLMTSAVAALGFLPMALSTSAGAEVQKPLATVVIGGLFTSTILTLLVLPVLYTFFKKATPMKVSPSTLLIALMSIAALAPTAANAQSMQPITSDSAVATALKRNPEMNLSQQRIDQQRALKPTTFNLLQPDLIFEAPTGEDLRPGVLQMIDFPTVYSTQRQAQNRRVEIAETERKITVNNLIYRVRSGYNQLQFLLAKNRSLESQDSVYRDLIKVNDIRYRVGQISNLERINGESQYKRILFNLKQTRAELRNAKYQFNLLIGYPNDTSHIPAEQLLKIGYVIEETPVDTTYLIKNPLLAFTRQNELLSKKILQVERSKRIPGFVGGFLNQGNDATPLAARVRVGITLPIWQWTYQGHINAAKKGIEIAQTQRQLSAYQLNTEYAKALADYRQFRDNLEYFESVGIREAEEILRNAKESFRLGSINYYAFLQNLELSFTIRQNYLETLKNYNQSVLNLLYLKGELLTNANY